MELLLISTRSPPFTDMAGSFARIASSHDGTMVWASSSIANRTGTAPARGCGEERRREDDPDPERRGGDAQGEGGRRKRNTSPRRRE
jgi:hypothetical protein